MRPRRVRAQLMGGQACVLCGAAEFSRETDLAIQKSAARQRDRRYWLPLGAELEKLRHAT